MPSNNLTQRSGVWRKRLGVKGLNLSETKQEFMQFRKGREANFYCLASVSQIRDESIQSGATCTKSCLIIVRIGMVNCVKVTRKVK